MRIQDDVLNLKINRYSGSFIIIFLSLFNVIIAKPPDSCTSKIDTVFQSIKWSLITVGSPSKFNDALLGCSYCDMYLAEIYDNNLYQIFAQELLKAVSINGKSIWLNAIYNGSKPVWAKSNIQITQFPQNIDKVIIKSVGPICWSHSESYTNGFLEAESETSGMADFAICMNTTAIEFNNTELPNATRTSTTITNVETTIENSILQSTTSTINTIKTTQNGLTTITELKPSTEQLTTNKLSTQLTTSSEINTINTLQFIANEITTLTTPTNNIESSILLSFKYDTTSTTIVQNSIPKTATTNKISMLTTSTSFYIQSNTPQLTSTMSTLETMTSDRNTLEILAIEATTISSSNNSTTFGIWSEWNPWSVCILRKCRFENQTGERNITYIKVNCSLIRSYDETVVKIEKVQIEKIQEIKNKTEAKIQQLKEKYSLINNVRSYSGYIAIIAILFLCLVILSIDATRCVKYFINYAKKNRVKRNRNSVSPSNIYTVEEKRRHINYKDLIEYERRIFRYELQLRMNRHKNS